MVSNSSIATRGNIAELVSISGVQASCSAHSLQITPPAGCADVMYIQDAVAGLAASLGALTSCTGAAYVAHGRNRGAEDAFMQAMAAVWEVHCLGPAELHPRYQAPDVTVFRFTKR
jgi:hypothetical protein